MRVIVRTAVFLAGWMLLAGALGAVSNLAPVHPEMQARRTLLRQQSESIQALSFGASHAGAVAFDETGFHGFHLWNAGSDLHETAFLLDEIVPQTPQVRCVLIALSPLQIDADNGAPVARDRRARRRELYAHTWSTRHIRGDFGSFIAGKMSVIVRDDHWKRVWQTLLGQRPSSPVQPDGNHIRDDDDLPAERLAEHGPARAALHRATRDSMLTVRPRSGLKARNALRESLERATARGVGVILYTPPYHRAYLDALEPDEIEAVRRLGAELAALDEGIVYGDFAVHPAFADSAAVFRNSDHLNERGGRMLSRLLLRPLMQQHCR